MPERPVPPGAGSLSDKPEQGTPVKSKPVKRMTHGPPWLQRVVAIVQVTVTFTAAPLAIVLHLRYGITLWWLLAALALSALFMGLRSWVDGGD